MNIGQACPKVMRLIAGIFLVAVLFPSSSAYADDPLPAADPVQMVVAKQMSAFRERNSAEAYAALSQAFQGRARSPLRFATMMRLDFWELYNHASYRFLGRGHSGGIHIQKVEVQGTDGETFIFLFRMVPSSSGDWRIDDVMMLEPDGQET